MNVVALTGAGVSAESGLETFRSADGLWANHRIEDVCTPEALSRDPRRVLEFYNERRRGVLAAQPNAGHVALAQLEAEHRVTILTQNIDDLHERAGSTNVIHLHGEVLKVRSMGDPELVLIRPGDTNLGDLGPDGHQLRPHVCFFGEMPYRWDEAEAAAWDADVFVVVGTSLNVYPAAGLVSMTRATKIFLIDPEPPAMHGFGDRLTVIREPASTGVKRLSDLLR